MNQVPEYGIDLKFCTAEKECYHVDEQVLEISYMVPTPKGRTSRDPSLTPITVRVVRTIGTIETNNLLKVLLDPGSTKTLINKKVVPRKAKLVELSKQTKVTTLVGTMTTSKMVML